MLASSSALMNASSRPRAASAWPGVIGLVRAVRSCSAQAPVFRQRRGVHDRADGAEAVADPAVGGQEGPLGGGGAGDAEQPAGGRGELAEQQPGGLGEEQRPVIQRQAQQRGEHGAHRQRAGPPGARGPARPR